MDIEQLLNDLVDYWNAKNELEKAREQSDRPYDFSYLASHLYDRVENTKTAAETSLSTYIEEQVKKIING